MDLPIFTNNINLPLLYSNNKITFDPKWLLSESYGIKGDSAQKEIPDSLKTHPNCKKRKENLLSIIKANNYSYDNISSLGNFDFYKIISEFYNIELLTESSNYGVALYYALQYQTIYPDNLFLKCVTFNSLYEIFRANQGHRFSMMVDLPSIYYSEPYNQFLIYLNNIRTNDLKQLCINYAQYTLPEKDASPYFQYAKVLLKNIDSTEDKLSGSIINFKKSCIDNYYIKLLALKVSTK